MPHDKHGDELHVSDLVTVRCRVKELHLTEEFCNVTLETVEPMFPGTNLSGMVLNAKQTELFRSLLPNGSFGGEKVPA